MADASAKKNDSPKKSAGGGGGKKSGGGLSKGDDVEIIIGALIVLLLIGALIRNISSYLSSGSFANNSFGAAVNSYLGVLIPIGKIISIGVSALCVVGIAFIIPKITKIRKEERAILYPPVQSQTEAIKNRKWERITEHINSANPNDWKLAILEADIILDDMLDSMGYHGATMGDKLKAVDKSDFLTIDSAWEAHKVRNLIAHEGSEFLLNDREARRIIGLYESIFKEFNFI